MPTPILGIPEVAPTQSDKVTTINDMLLAVEGATQDQLTVSMAGGDLTLTTTQFTRAAFFVISSLTASRTLTVPNSKRMFVIRNPTGFDLLVKSGSGSTVSVLAGTGAVLQTDGANNTFVFGAGGQGAPGSLWREGPGVPSNSLGIDGDFYLNGTNGDVYQRAAGVYGIIANIRGPAGAAGSFPTTGAGKLVGNAGTVAATAGDISIGTGLSLSSGATLSTDAAVVEVLSHKGAANGYAGLDSGGRVPLAQLPASLGEALYWQGTWNASTNTPTLASGAGSNGAVYTVTVAGTTTLDGISSWNVGDKVAFDGTASVWRKIDGLPIEWNAGGVTTLGAGLVLNSGTLSATGSGGTVTQVVAGTGLSGGPITNTGTLSLAPEVLNGARNRAYLADVNGIAGTYSNGAAGVGATLTATTNGYFALDGLTAPTDFSAGITVLLTGQGDGTENGHYTLTDAGSASTPWVLTRTPGWDQGDRILGALIAITAGTVFFSAVFRITGYNGSDAQPAVSALTIGTDTIEIDQINGVVATNWGAGLDYDRYANRVFLAAFAGPALLGVGSGTASPSPISLGNGLEIDGTGALSSDVQATQTVAASTANISPTGRQSVAVTLQANTTLTIGAGYDGQHLRLKLIQDATGHRTMAFDSSVKFGTDIPSFTASTAANAIDIVQLIYDASHTRWMFAAVNHGF